MFTPIRFPVFQPTGDWGVDGPKLNKHLHDYWLALEKKGALAITEASLDGSPVGADDPDTGAFTTLSATALSVEGTSWTPAITCTTPGDLSVSFAGGVQIGERFKLGGLNIAHFRLSTSTFTHTTASGDLHITGLTPTAATLANFAWVGGIEFSGITKATYTQFSPRVASADNKILIRASGSGVGAALVQITDLPTGGSVVLNGTVVYRA